MTLEADSQTKLHSVLLENLIFLQLYNKFDKSGNCSKMLSKCNDLVLLENYFHEETTL